MLSTFERSEHLGQSCIVNLDVKEFFPKIRHYMVYRMFRRDLGFGRDVARLLTRLTTLNAQLPQGAPTSTAIANVLLALPIDRPIAIEAQRYDVRYTRFVDDIAISGSDPRPLINFVARVLSRRRLPIYRNKGSGQAKQKLKITPRSRAQEVTGLIVNSGSLPSVSNQRRANIRAAIFGLHQITDKILLRTSVQSIRGRIAYVRQFNPGAASRLQTYLKSVLSTYD